MRKLYLVFMILPLLVFTACGLDHKSKNPGTGSLKFSVDWKGAPNLLSAAPGIFRAPIDCNAAGVATVEATLRGSNDNTIGCINGTCATGPWLCSAHTGTITGLPAQSGIKVGIIARDAIGGVVFYGEAPGTVTITEGQTTDVGPITALPIRTLATTTASPVAVAVDGTNVYWIENGATTTSGTVKSAPLSGGTPTILASGLGQLQSIAVDATMVYFAESSNASNNAGLKQVLKTGGTVTTLAGFPSFFNLQGLAVDSTSVYFVATKNGQSGNGIFKTLVSGGTVTDIATSLTGQISNIAVDATNVYFAVMNNQTGPIMSAPISGATPANPAVIVPNLTSVQAIGIDSTNIYWTDRQFTDNTNSVKKVLKTGGTVTPLVTSTFQSSMPAMLVDGTNVYWPVFTSSTVFLNSVGINGGEVRRLAPADIQQTGGNVGPGLAIDSTSIYWPESTTGKIKSAAKQ